MAINDFTVPLEDWKVGSLEGWRDSILSSAKRSGARIEGCGEREEA